MKHCDNTCIITLYQQAEEQAELVCLSIWFRFKSSIGSICFWCLIGLDDLSAAQKINWWIHKISRFEIRTKLLKCLTIWSWCECGLLRLIGGLQLHCWRHLNQWSAIGSLFNRVLSAVMNIHETFQHDTH